MTELRGIQQIDIDHEMQQSYLDYAMSVIISRAIPDARDGLKPVQRRILYAMYDMGIRPDSSYKKSARIVGEVLGKYHPHGDSAVYDAMARLAQDFSIRYPLVEGQGNFGSIDGDPPAAMRYTEARLDKFSMELLNHIDQGTVDFTRNFDDSLEEPTVLPSIIPNLLVNGASGIAVGMATNIPPHNLGEVCDAIIYLLQEWEHYENITVDDLMSFIKGPDFPTGGIIVLEDERNEMQKAYATGRGRLTVRGRVHLEDIGRGKTRLVITEIPYQVNKTGLIERIAQLVRTNTIQDVTDLRDESDRQGMRIVIELSKTGDAEKILRQLYKHTPLQTTFGIILLALVDEQPRVLSLKQALRVYANHQLTVIQRRTEFELAKAKRRAHILEGLLAAIKDLDEVIRIIRTADDETDARNKLIARLSIDEIQAQAILDMPLKRLTHLEFDKLQTEYDELQSAISEMEILLNSPEKMREELITELSDLKKRYADARRTQIALLAEGESSKELLMTNALLDADEVWVGMTKSGKIGRCEQSAIEEKTIELPQWIVRTDTQQTVYIVSETGLATGLYVETLPRVENFEDGVDFGTISGWDPEEKPEAVFSLPSSEKMSEKASVITVTKNAMLKRTLASEIPFASAKPFQICKVNPKDSLLTVLVSEDDEKQLLLATQNGMAIRFGQDELRTMGLAAAGVNGMKLKEGDQIIGALIVSEEETICFASSDWGLGRLAISEFPKQGRYGQGVIAVRLKEGTAIMGISHGLEGKSLLIIHYGKNKIRRLKLDAAKITRRARTLEAVGKNLSEGLTGIVTLSLSPHQKDSLPAKSSSEEPAKETISQPSDSSSAENSDENKDNPQEPLNPEQFSLF